MRSPVIPTSMLPWFGAVMVGISVHVGWLANTHSSSAATVRSAAAIHIVAVPVAASAPICPAQLHAAVPVKADGPAPSPARRHTIAGAQDAINCSGTLRCTIQRGFVDKLMAEPSLLAKQARVVPSQVDGLTRGFKLYGIRSGSLPQLLGFRNGDMVTAVNDQTLTSVDRAFQIAMQLRTATDLRIELVRDGKPLTKRLQIHD